MSTTDQHDAERIDNDDEHPGLHRTTGQTVMSRRGALKTGATTLIAAAAMSQSAAAEHEAPDYGDDDDEQEDDGALGDITVRDLATAATFSPAIHLGQEAGHLPGDGGTVYDLLDGYFDSGDRQLRADLYLQGLTTVNMLADSMEHMELTYDGVEHIAVADAMYFALQEIEDSGSREDVQFAAYKAAADVYATAQKSVFRYIEGLFKRLVQFQERQIEAGHDPEEYIVRRDYSGAHEAWLEPVHVELANGEVFDTFALGSQRPEELLDDDDEPSPTVWHPVLFDSSNSTSTVARFETDPGDDLDEELVELAELLDEYDVDDDGDGSWVDDEDINTSWQTDRLYLDGGPAGRDDLDLVPDGYSGVSDATDWANWLQRDIYREARTIRREVWNMASDMYDLWDSGDVDTTDLITPSVYAERLAHDFMGSGGAGYRRGLAIMLGQDTDVGGEQTIQVASSGTHPEEDGIDKAVDYADTQRRYEFTEEINISEAGTDVTVALEFDAVEFDGTYELVNDDDPLEVTIDPWTADHGDEDDDDRQWDVTSVTVEWAERTVTEPVHGRDSSDSTARIDWEDLEDGSDAAIEEIRVRLEYRDDDGELRETDELIDDSAGIDVTTSSAGDYAVEYEGVLATDWRPEDRDPDGDLQEQTHVFSDVELTEDDHIDVETVIIAEETDDGTYRAKDDETVTVTVAGDWDEDGSDVEAVTLNTDEAGTVRRTIDQDGVAEFTHDSLADTADEYTLGDLTVEYTNDAGEDDEDVIGSIDVTVAPEELTDEDLRAPDFELDEWYDGEAAVENDKHVSVITTDDDGWRVVGHSWFQVVESLDGDGDELDGVYLQDTGRTVIDADRVDEEVEAGIDTQQTIEEEMEDSDWGETTVFTVETGDDEVFGGGVFDTGNIDGVTVALGGAVAALLAAAGLSGGLGGGDR